MGTDKQHENTHSNEPGSNSISCGRHYGRIIRCRLVESDMKEGVPYRIGDRLRNVGMPVVSTPPNASGSVDPFACAVAVTDSSPSWRRNLETKIVVTLREDTQGRLRLLGYAINLRVSEIDDVCVAGNERYMLFLDGNILSIIEKEGETWRFVP